MRGVVVAPQPMAAEIGAELLARGGNAFDAAIGTAFAQMVTDPQMCGLGGFGCATYASPGGTQHVAFHARAGSGATPEMWAADFRGRTELGNYTLFDDHRANLGHTSVGTPGVVAGLASLHAHARLPWLELIEPGASLARRGFPAPEYVFEFVQRAQQPGMPGAEQRMKYTRDSARLWCRDDGSIKRPGDHWSNPNLADTLDQLARSGARDLYEGDLADRVADELARGGGYVTRDDLRTYAVRPSDPIGGTFRGLRVASAAPPASGITCVQMLQVLNHFEPLVSESANAYVLLAGAMHEAFAARLRAVADPDFVDVPIAELTSAAWAEAAAGRIRQQVRGPVAASVGGEGTTHVSTYDEEGNAVALTHTLGIFSGVIVPGTGIALNSGMDLFDPIPGGPNSIRPGKARVSGMAPTIVFDGQRPAIVSGAPGTNAIVTSVLQVIVGLVDGKLSPVEAVSAPRVHCEGGPVFVEGRVSRHGREALAQAGFDLRLMPTNYVPGFGRNQVISIDARGSFRGASDPRRDGGVAAYS
ncbi:MAG TPA: gamma-glutamyltransferase [Chloroflexota bacterium]|jgi:gamma-glutamyltranspeptidase/glutathione hydrolase